jgi:RNA polymerase sigma-70 factor, ECF subfamily
MTERLASAQTSEVQSPELPRAGTSRETTAQPSDFQSVFAGHFSYVWAALRRLGVAERELEDLTQEVFLRVFGQLEQFDAARPVRPWLFGFAFRVASDYRRLARHKREILDPQKAESADPAPSALDHVLKTEALLLAQTALEELDLDRRAVFILHELDDCPMPEVAEALSIPLNTAYSRLRLAREQFAACVRRLRLQRGDR